MNEKDFIALQKIYYHEQQNPVPDEALGWEWQDVNVYPGTIRKLVMEGLVVIRYRSNRYTHYALTPDGVLRAQGLVEGPVQRSLPGIPPDLFSHIIGYDDVKELIRTTLELEKPVHVLLCGPPSIAKSLFLWEIESIGGELALAIDGSAASQPGVWDLIVERRPRWVLVNELEKMKPADTASLLSLMEEGRVIRAKVGRTVDERITTWVLATANRVSRLSPELMSRFAVCELKPYNAGEFNLVVQGVLVDREGISPEDAHEIASRLANITQDVRDAVRVARLSTRIGVARAVELLFGEGSR